MPDVISDTSVIQYLFQVGLLDLFEGETVSRSHQTLINEAS
jgi:hypothetical protein